MSDYNSDIEDNDEFNTDDITISGEFGTVESQSTIEARERLQRYRDYFTKYGNPGTDYAQMGFDRLREMMIADFSTLPLISKDTPLEEIDLEDIKAHWIQSGRYVSDPLSKLFKKSELEGINHDKLKKFLVGGLEARNSITIRMKLYNTLVRKLGE